MAFALYEMKMVLATFLERADLRLVPKEPIRAVRRSITLAPSEGLRVRVEARRPRESRAARSEGQATAASSGGKNERSIEA
jgi:hypothetical protein